MCATVRSKPLLAAIAAYKAGKQAPHWVQNYMPRSM